jgi:hypothetical protein
MIKRHLSAAAGYREQISAPGVDPLSFFSVFRDFREQADFTTESAASKTWFISAPNQIVANQGSGDGEELFSNDTSQHASSTGWEVVPEGIKILGSEIAIKVRMWDGTNEDGLNHDRDGSGNGGTDPVDDYLMVFVEEYQAGMSNDRRKKFNGPGSKIQNNNPKNVKHNDDYSTSSGSFVEAGDDSVELPIGFDPTNGTLMMFAFMRDTANQRIYQWIIELEAGNSSASDMFVNDTLTQSTADGEAWYLVTGNVRTDGSDQLEHFFQEDTVLRYYGFKNFTDSDNLFSTIDTFIRSWADDIIASL